jgi:hypothetical protein
MRVAIAVLTFSILAASIASAALVLPRPRMDLRFRLSSATELRQTKIPPSPRVVTGGGSRPADWTLGGSGAAASAYKTGNGVVLGPLNMYDVTGSQLLGVYNACVTPGLTNYLRTQDPNTAIEMHFQGPQNPIYPTIIAVFANLPSGMHTYVLTLGLKGPTVEDCVKIKIGNMEFAKGSMVMNPPTSEARVMFSYQAGTQNNQRILTVCVFKVGPLTSLDMMYLFHHLQLVQLD